MENLEKLSQEVHDLKQKYETVIKKLDGIEKENAHRENSIKRIENSFDVMNNNFRELMDKIDVIVEDRETHKMFNQGKRSNFSLINMIKRPIRKLTVGTISSIFAITEYASEKAACTREGLEDIIAEAKYESQKKRVTLAHNEQC